MKVAFFSAFRPLQPDERASAPAANARPRSGPFFFADSGGRCPRRRPAVRSLRSGSSARPSAFARRRTDQQVAGAGGPPAHVGADERHASGQTAGIARPVQGSRHRGRGGRRLRLARRNHSAPTRAAFRRGCMRPSVRFLRTHAARRLRLAARGDACSPGEEPAGRRRVE
jgi:hypothetical protein